MTHVTLTGVADTAAIMVSPSQLPPHRPHAATRGRWTGHSKQVAHPVCPAARTASLPAKTSASDLDIADASVTVTTATGLCSRPTKHPWIAPIGPSAMSVAAAADRRNALSRHPRSVRPEPNPEHHAPSGRSPQLRSGRKRRAPRRPGPHPSRPVTALRPLEASTHRYF